MCELERDTKSESIALELSALGRRIDAAQERLREESARLGALSEYVRSLGERIAADSDRAVSERTQRP